MLRKGLVLGGVCGVAYMGSRTVDDRIGDATPDSLYGGIRLFRTLYNVGVTAADYKLNLKDKSDPDHKKSLRECNLRAAKRLYKVCHRNGGLYNKFGQTVANLNHVLPPEFTETLAPLQDKAREMESEMALKAIENELPEGKTLEDVFEWIEGKPIAAASLAQVHRAKLKDTKDEVAVKIQYPYLKRQTKGDVATLELVTDLVGYMFPDFSYSWLSGEFKDNITLELDFVQEGYNADRLAKHFHNHADVYVPKIEWKYTTKKMLVMEFIDGIKITNVHWMEEKGINPLEVASTVSSVFGDMIHVTGFVHCDPHPGNLMVRLKKDNNSYFNTMASYFIPTAVVGVLGYSMFMTSFINPIVFAGLSMATSTVSILASASMKTKDSGGTISYARQTPYQLVVLDHGMYRRLDPEFRKNYCELWKSLLFQDPKIGRRAAIAMGVPEREYDVISMIFLNPQGGVPKEKRRQVREQYQDVTAGDINQFLQGLPRDLLFVLRATNIVRSINLSLGGTTRMRFKIMGESAVRGVLVPNASPEQFKQTELQHPEVPTTGPYAINKPVTAEIIDADTITYQQMFDMWRLKTYLTLIDKSWALLAAIVKAL